jgi:alpha-amylase/alpha-mannosidase (GH57 family)
VLPLIPAPDRDEQLARWLGLGRHLFPRDRFRGFWPPELGFCMDLVPTVARHGYDWVIVDSEHVRALTPMSWEELRYRPHRARVDDAELIVVVRDRDLSNAQESGMDAHWFIEEVRARTQHCDFPPLVTTATDGDNGGWFRNTTHGSNFWSGFYDDLLDRVRAGRSGGIRPAFINDYLDRHGTHGWVTVEPGAWNTGDHHGTGFVQWTGSAAQRDALARVSQLSDAVRAAGNTIGADGWAAELLEQARWRVLRAETSCNLFWGEAWVPRCHDDLDEAAARRDQALHAAHAVA